MVTSIEKHDSLIGVTRDFILFSKEKFIKYQWVYVQTYFNLLNLCENFYCMRFSIFDEKFQVC